MKIVHLSDLHFGTESPNVVERLGDALAATAPDLVIVSGDFTQRALNREFLKARGFLDRLPAPAFCVPGNHDIPWQPSKRLFEPYARYKRHIGDTLAPVFENDEVVIAGVKSTRRVLPHWNWAHGAISRSQLDRLEKIFSEAGNRRRILVSHHPIVSAFVTPKKTKTFGARDALIRLNEMQVELVLSGHIHHAAISTFGDADHTTIYLSASTALSTRLRDQQNGYNIIDIDHEKMDIEIHDFSKGDFKLCEQFSRKL